MTDVIEITEQDITAHETAAQVNIDRARKMQKLMSNREFKALFLDHYFSGYASDLVRMKSFPQCQDESTQQQLDREITAVGEVQQFIEAIFAMGRQSEKTLLDMEALREELAEEEAEA